MAGQRNIETGVDKLVSLINRKKKISINAAADELGVGMNVLQEWADFLEDESLITVDYKFNKTYLCERKLTKKEIEKKARVYASKKDAFTRKVEFALKSLQKESAGFEQIKSEFKKLKDTIGRDVDQVRQELQELRHYEDLKKNIDRDIIQQRFDFQVMLQSIHRQVAEQKKKYEHFIDQISMEKTKIEEARVEMSYLEKREENITKRIDSLKEVIKSVEKKISEQRVITRSALDRARAKLKEADKIHETMAFRMKSELEPVIKISREKEEKILGVQEFVLKKITDRKKEMDKYKFESTKAAEKFKAFFGRKARTQQLITALDKDKAMLEKELQGLITKAQSFNLSIKSANVKKYVQGLQASFKEIEKKKSSFVRKFEELTDMITMR